MWTVGRRWVGAACAAHAGEMTHYDVHSRGRHNARGPYPGEIPDVSGTGLEGGGMSNLAFACTHHTRTAGAIDVRQAAAYIRMVHLPCLPSSMVPLALGA